ncbi:MAG: VanZ family protein [Candidatus Kryptoniota bacterium]
MNLKKSTNFLKNQLPAILWMVLIFTLSSIPGSAYAPFEFPYAHTIAHTILFGILYFLLYRAFKYQSYSRLFADLSTLIAFVFAVLYGMSDEYHQSFVPGRSEKLSNVLNDTVAALVVFLGIVVYEKFIKSRQNASHEE